MPEIRFSELPEHLRVKLTEKGTEELWHRVNEFGGIKKLSESFEFSQSKMYNWKNKDLAMPVKFVKRLMGQNAKSEIVLLKGKGNSKGLKEFKLPIDVSNKLLTRLNESVKVNEEGIPFYMTSEISLAKRFVELLEDVGDGSYKIYSRETRYEVRFPKFLYTIFSQMNFEKDLPALIDEKGKITENGVIIVESNKIDLDKVENKLYSKQKQFEIALKSGHSDKISELIAEESDKVRKLTS